jgi:MtrB/PioB family decaheme-associated outer membrane protein
MSRLILKPALAALLAAAAAAHAERPDTSAWKCEKCPFEKGYAAEAGVGAIYADGANYSFGRYSGIDDDGKTYVDARASGSWKSGSGAFARYEFTDLGLDSRAGRIVLGRDGRFDVALSYDGLPYRRYDMTMTPFTGFTDLTLPAGWVRGTTTATMSSLAASLGDRDVQTERKTYGVAARYLPGRKWALFANYQRQEKKGTGIVYGSVFTQAVQLPEPIDYTDDTFEAGVAWQTARASARLAFSGSQFSNSNAALTWQHPYASPFATTGRLALAPENDLTQVSLTGNFRFDFWGATLAYSASAGRLEQDDALLPVSTAPGATAPKPTLDGEIDLMHYGLALALRPLPKLALRGNWRYDERDDQTDPVAVAYVVTDALAGGTEFTPRYDYERSRLDGAADYALLRWLRIGGGLQYDEVKREQQEVAKTVEDGGYLRARVTPLESLSFTLKRGQFHRDAKDFDLTVRDPDENPLLRKYNLANRDRTYYELLGSWSPAATVTLSLQGKATDDAYRRSPLGLTDGKSRTLGANVAWSPQETLTFYLDGGYQKMRSKQLGQARPDGAAWELRNEDEFWNVGVGGRWVYSETLSFTADLTQAESSGDTRLYAGAAADAYPQQQTQLTSARLGAHWQATPALALSCRLAYESYDEDNWALDGVTPAAVPNLLALGAAADSHDTGLLAFSFTYRFGTVGAPAAPKSEE